MFSLSYFEVIVNLPGQASGENAKAVGLLAEFMVLTGWSFASGDDKPCGFDKPLGGKRMYSTSSTKQVPSFLATSVCDLSPRVQAFHKQVKDFIRVNISPIEEELDKYYMSNDRWTPHAKIEELKDNAKQAGLWNFFIPKEADEEGQYGPSLTNMEYSFLCEEMGKCLYASEVFNCSAPDTGNMEVLIRYGTQDQKDQWLTPLLDGQIRSCFAMTEPQVASSDATNIQSSIRLDGDQYVINGRKWWISGALHPKCKVAIFMGKTDPDAPKHKQQAMILVPMDTPGVSVIRPLSVFGYEDAPAGHAEILFEDVRVPKENILLGPGRGFEIAQVKNRVAFGKPLAAQGTILADIAASRIEIEQSRLLTLKAAHLMDTVGNKAAAPEIAMIKVAGPQMAQNVIDRAMQAFGAAGLSSDQPLAQFFSWARVLRLADGPDEVHARAVARMELKK
ncbi:Acyl-CoA dehydrogenase family member 10 [Exaiptasia diaphana]|nr:Acyl-CoA dehydrogenase family member 10 [Exaiptasia diaphana]